MVTAAVRSIFIAAIASNDFEGLNCHNPSWSEHAPCPENHWNSNHSCSEVSLLIILQERVPDS